MYIPFAFVLPVCTHGTHDRRVVFLTFSEYMILFLCVLYVHFWLNNELTLLCSYFITSAGNSNNFTRPSDKYTGEVCTAKYFQLWRRQYIGNERETWHRKAFYYHVQLQIGNLILPADLKIPNVQNNLYLLTCKIMSVVVTCFTI